MNFHIKPKWIILNSRKGETHCESLLIGELKLRPTVIYPLITWTGCLIDRVDRKKFSFWMTSWLAVTGQKNWTPSPFFRWHWRVLCCTNPTCSTTIFKERLPNSKLSILYSLCPFQSHHWLERSIKVCYNTIKYSCKFWHCWSKSNQGIID